MADTRQRTTLGNWFRLIVRFAGLTGALAVAVGTLLLAVGLPGVDLSTLDGWQAFPDQLHAASDGRHGDLAQWAAWCLAGGAIAVAIAVVVELLSGLILGLGRRTAAGTVATTSIVAALVLLGIVNYYSFTHHRRFDCTRDQRFTLPPELARELSQLRGNAPTTIVVLQMHNMFGNLSAKRDSFTSAAERLVTEKVRDLVDLFRTFGPQFRVVVLDTEAFGYQSELDELTKNAPELRAAIESANENSIFFHAHKRVQRLTFNEFLQLDKTASRTFDNGQGNLVLLPQGIDRFAQRILTVQERRPKVAVCVVHEALSTARADGWRARYTMAGLRKALNDAGFDVTDIVLKKNWGQPGGTQPAADTREESALERLESEAREASARLATAVAEVNILNVIRDELERLKNRPWPERRAFYSQLFNNVRFEEQEPQIRAFIDRRSQRADEELKEASQANQEAEKRLAEALQNERYLQDRRMTDIGAKFQKQLEDVDLLILPRFTTEDAMEGPEVEAAIHALSREQVQVIKDFMKRGKPVLVCFGAITPQVNPQQGESADDFDRRLANELAAGIDDLERLIAERGIEMGNSLILFDGETRSLTADQFGNNPADVPPLVVAEPPAPETKLLPNPVAAALRLTARTAESNLDIKLKALRPVTVVPSRQQRFAPEILYTVPETWNDLQPFPIVGRRRDGARVLVYTPKYEPVGIGDPKKGRRDEERRGPFSVAVAIESPIPVAWVQEDFDRQRAAAALFMPFDNLFTLGLTLAADRIERPQQRMIVIGSGTVFTGKELTPGQEKLLVHSVNWLTGRDDRLPRADVTPWHYPRVALSDRQRNLWRWGGWFGPPVAVAYLGLIVMLIRRMR
ncbi:MAG: hypothetical protein RMJ56_00315 [Gemmataceae bacterium]|nr:hypothetical protein [Gemmata sp.]MDW8196023.1 hypothetical protein [Gemmataceae bacterium]